ncbi:hypothetical protein AAC387_Pa11g1296 [Persea americana]
MSSLTRPKAPSLAHRLLIFTMLYAMTHCYTASVAASDPNSRTRSSISPSAIRQRVDASIHMFSLSIRWEWTTTMREAVSHHHQLAFSVTCSSIFFSIPIKVELGDIILNTMEMEFIFNDPDYFSVPDPNRVPYSRLIIVLLK